MARTAGSVGSETAQRILQASLQLFSRYGYAAVSMRQIAAEVGLAGRTGDRTIQAVADAAQHDQQQCGEHMACGDEAGRHKPDHAGNERDMVGPHAAGAKPKARSVERPLNQFFRCTVQHFRLSTQTTG